MVAEKDGSANANYVYGKALEKFKPVKYSENTISFKGSHGKFLVCESDGKVVADESY